MKINENLISKDKLKEVLITKTAIKALKDVSEVEKVINFIFKDAHSQLRYNNTVEISGFGIFSFSLSKLEKSLEVKELALKNIKEGRKYVEKTEEFKTKIRKSLEASIAETKAKIDEIKRLRSERDTSGSN